MDLKEQMQNFVSSVKRTISLVEHRVEQSSSISVSGKLFKHMNLIFVQLF